MVTNVDCHYLSDLELLCNHPKKWWTIPWSGERFFSAHPPFIPSEQWDASMLAGRQPDGDYLTRAAAAYPADLNKALAVALREACDNMGRVPDTVTVVSRQLDNKVEMGLPLKRLRVQEKSQEDTYSKRDIHKSVRDRALYVGKQIANLIEKRLDESDVEHRTISNIGRSVDEIDLPTQWIDELRVEVHHLLSRNRLPNMEDACNLEPSNPPMYQTSIRGN